MTPEQELEIRMLIEKTYGRGSFASRMADHIIWRINEGASDREVLRICWNWMTGGDTAAATTNKIWAILDKNAE